jgi:hypothetical protein
MQSRLNYFSDLLRDTQDSTDEPGLQAALIIGDGLNGIRKALLDLTEQQRKANNLREFAPREP